MICKMTNAALFLMEFQGCLRKTAPSLDIKLTRGLATYMHISGLVLEFPERS